MFRSVTRDAPLNVDWTFKELRNSFIVPSRIAESDTGGEGPHDLSVTSDQDFCVAASEDIELIIDALAAQPAPPTAARLFVFQIARASADELVCVAESFTGEAQVGMVTRRPARRRGAPDGPQLVPDPLGDPTPRPARQGHPDGQGSRPDRPQGAARQLARRRCPRVTSGRAPPEYYALDGNGAEKSGLPRTLATSSRRGRRLGLRPAMRRRSALFGHLPR